MEVSLATVRGGREGEIVIEEKVETSVEGGD